MDTLLMTSVLGAKVCVINQTRKWECLSIVKEPSNGTFNWTVENFSTLCETCYVSKVFTVEHSKWYILILSNLHLVFKGSEKKKKLL